MAPTRTAAADTADMIAPADVAAMAAEAERDATSFVALNKVDVVDLVTLDRAVRIRVAIAEKRDAIVAQIAKPKRWANSLHKWFCALEADACRPLDDLDTYERRQIGAYKTQRDRERAEQERVESERLQREREAQATQAAAAYEQVGERAMANAVLEAAVTAPPPVVVIPDETKQVDGLKFTRRWSWRYANGPQVIKDTPPAVIARSMELIPRAYLCVDEKKLGAVVRHSKGTISIPGIDVYYVDDPVR